MLCTGHQLCHDRQNDQQVLRERLYDQEGIIKKQAVESLVQLALADGVINESDLEIIETFVEGIFVDGDPIVVTSCAKSLALMSRCLL